MEAEIRLSGGNFDSNVVRAGDTVRRAAGPWTPAVHALLTHLSRVGFAAAPRPLGLDELGREVLTFLDGEVGAYPLAAYMRTDEVLISAFRLLREFHDAAATFIPPDGAAWRELPPDPGPVEVVCHGDWTPYNAVFRDERLVAFIDWDFARPGSRIWDVAWAASAWAPLRGDAHCQAEGWPRPPDRRARLRLVCDAYGLDDVSGLVEACRDRCLATAAWLRDGAARGEEPFVRLVRAGDPESYERDAGWIAANAGALNRES